MKDNLNPFCEKCKFFRKISDKHFVCGKFNLKMEPLDRTELRYGCYEKEKNKEIFQFSPNFYGIGVNIKNLIKKFFK